MEYKVGNLVDAFSNGEIKVLMHQCNCFCNFGAGIAKEIKKKFPYAYYTDCETKKGDKSKLGTSSVCLVEEDEGFICNIYGQYHWKPEKGKRICTEYNHLESGLRNTLDYLTGYDENMTIGIPLIGCGLAGGDWKVVSKIIEKLEAEYPQFKFVVYTLK